MKKYRYLLVCLFAVLTGLFVMACSDDDSNDSAIVGTWKYSSDDDYYYSGEDDDEYIMFCSDGTCYSFEKCSSHGYDVEKAKYVYSNGKLALTYYDDEERFVQTVDVVISGNQMVVTFFDSGEKESELYTKVKSPLTQSQLEKYYKDNLSDYSY